VDQAKSLPDGFSTQVSLNFVYNNIGVNTQHLFIDPCKDVTKLLKEGIISDNLIGGTLISNVNILENSRFNGYVDGDGG